MEYREQLKVIRSHKWNKVPEGRKNSNKKNNKEKKSKKKATDRLISMVQIVASTIFLVATMILGIIPLKYILLIIVFLLVLWLGLRYMQRRVSINHKKKHGGKGFGLIISVLLLLASFYIIKVNAALDEIAVGEGSGKYSQEHSVNVTKSPFNIYISGIDVYGDITQKSRSDVNLIVTVNPNTHKILITTTPRDYYVQIPGISGEEYDKLTHAGLYGIDRSMDTLANLYDTEIPFYIRVNFTSVEEIVDVMGGVDVESELAFSTGEDSGLVMDVKKGVNHFNGKQALAFARERQNLAAGDNQRGKNQQALLAGMMRKAMSPTILFKANGMINSVTGNAETNMAEKQIKDLLKMQLNDGGKWDVQSVAASGDDSGKRYCYSYKGEPLYVTVPDEAVVEKIQKKIKGIVNEE